jgi:hypothetical protein
LKIYRQFSSDAVQYSLPATTLMQSFWESTLHLRFPGSKSSLHLPAINFAWSRRLANRAKFAYPRRRKSPALVTIS